MRFQKLVFGNRSKALLNDVFSTDLYTGNGSTTGPVVTTGIDLLNEGGIQFFKRRDAASYPIFYNANRAGGRYITGTCSSTGDNNPFGENFDIGDWSATGISIKTDDNVVNTNAGTYVSHSFRISPKFFNLQTSVSVLSDNTISFTNLGSIGMVLVYDSGGPDIHVWHRSLTSGSLLKITPAAESVLGAITVSGTDVTLHSADLASIGVDVFAFAHDTSTLGKIVCGSYTGNGSATGPIITTGMQPQYIMIKRSIGGTGDWIIVDSERGITEGGNDVVTKLNLSAAEVSTNILSLTSDGFQLTTTSTDVNASGSTYIYMVIH